MVFYINIDLHETHRYWTDIAGRHWHTRGSTVGGIGRHRTGAACQLPVALNAEQTAVATQNLQTSSLHTMSRSAVATLCEEAYVGLHRTLDGFLSRIDTLENPRIFKLVAELKEKVDQQELPALADRILNGKPGVWDRFVGLFNKKALAKAMDTVWEETRRIATGKTKTLVDLTATMERELNTEKQKLEAEIRSMEQLKDAYRERYSDFIVAVAFASAFLEKAKAEVQSFEQTLPPGDMLKNADLVDLKDKLQALESRALALEGTLSRLPADQLTIRQIQNAGITTLQETSTTAAGRFASIKMTLLTIHGAMVTKGVQNLAAQGAALDANLMAVRGQLMRDVVTTAANAPGDNRLAQAAQIQEVVKETAALVTIVEQARSTNAQKFAQARETFEQARKDMLALGQQIRPDRPLNS